MFPTDQQQRDGAGGGAGLLLGLDIGTSNIKAVLFTADGRTLRVASRPTPTEALPNGHAIHHAGKLWGVVCEVMREAVAPVRGRVAGVAVASMGEEGFPLDSEGRPLYPGILWHDTRTLSQAKRWRERSDEVRVYEICGLPPQHIYTVHKLTWLRENEPEVWAQMQQWASVSGLVASRLCGVLAMDLSQASRTCLLDLRGREWSDELLALGDVPRHLFPGLVPSGARIGEVTVDASRQTGLQSGIPVAAGGHDHICGALAAGVVEPGAMLHSGGTAEGVLATLDAVATGPAGHRAALSLGCHVVPGRYYAVGGLYSGTAVRWVAQVTSRADGDDHQHAYVELADEARSVPPGAHGVFFLPYLHGQGAPRHDPEAAGAFLGLRAHHTRADLARAVFEGISYDARRLTDVFRADLGLRIDSVIAIGGLMRARLWVELKAALLDTPVTLIDTPEAVASGAAMLAGLAAGLYPDAAGAVRAVRRPAETIQPDPELVKEYNQRYREWLSLDAAVADMRSAIPLLRAGTQERGEQE